MASYLIKKGDTLGSIAKKYNTTVDELAKLNNISNVNLIKTGASLQLPGAEIEQPATVQNAAIKTPDDYLKNYDTGRPAYQQSQAVTDALATLSQAEANKPGAYQSSYSEQIQQMLDQILQRGDFKYDFNADPLYQQYKQQYQQQGQKAMMDTMGQAAALTGGYGSSYGQTVGQQVYQDYLGGLNNVVPELRQAALDVYNTKGNKMAQNLALVQGQDEQTYGRYMDDYNKYMTELDYLANKTNQMSQDEYNKYLNDVSSWEKDRDYWFGRSQWDYQLQQDAKAAASGGGRSGGGRAKSAQTNQSILQPSYSYETMLKQAWDGTLTYDDIWSALESGAIKEAQAEALGMRLDETKKKSGGGGSPIPIYKGVR